MKTKLKLKFLILIIGILFSFQGNAQSNSGFALSMEFADDTTNLANDLIICVLNLNDTANIKSIHVKIANVEAQQIIAQQVFLLNENQQLPSGLAFDRLYKKAVLTLGSYPEYPYSIDVWLETTSGTYLPTTQFMR